MIKRAALDAHVLIRLKDRIEYEMNSLGNIGWATQVQIIDVQISGGLEHAAFSAVCSTIFGCRPLPTGNFACRPLAADEQVIVK